MLNNPIAEETARKIGRTKLTEKRKRIATEEKEKIIYRIRKNKENKV